MVTFLSQILYCLQGFLCPLFRYKNMIVMERGNDIGADTPRSQLPANGGRQTHGLQIGMHVQTDLPEQALAGYSGSFSD